MSLEYEVLGAPGRDNALLVTVDSGQSVERILFDCGEGCLSGKSYGEIQSIDYLLFSHLHMDHVAGFDSFFRCCFKRHTKPNHLWGPLGSTEILQHRFQGFLWNMHGEMEGNWRVSEVGGDEIRTWRFELNEAFSRMHDEGIRPHEGVVLEGEGFDVEALVMDHGTPSLAYVLREKPRLNIDMAAMGELGLEPGPWLGLLKSGRDGPPVPTLSGGSMTMAELTDRLVRETKGDSLAYLTDFLLDDSALESLAEALEGCRVVVCEAQYREGDLELAQRNHHMTTAQSASLAKWAGVDELVLFHLSDRYASAEWPAMLNEAREIFSATSFPDGWNVERS